MSSKRFPIVAVGASAGGLQSFVRLLKVLPQKPGFAIIFIQHLDPNHDSMSAEILSQSTKFSVKEITDEEIVLINQVYTVPADYELRIKNGVLHLSSRESSLAPHNPINTFMNSLALDQANYAFGVILSGMGNDGTQGLLQILKHGGHTLSQNLKSTKYDSMPRSAAKEHAVNFVLPPDDIAKKLVLLTKQINHLNSTKMDPLPDKWDFNMQQIMHLIKDSSKIDYSAYKKTTLHRRIHRRMVLGKFATESAYVEFLKSDPHEVKILCSECLIHVTKFFRDPKLFQKLKTSIFQKLLAHKNTEIPFRIWVPGCSTGEEVYSHLFTLLDYMSTAHVHRAIQIFGTDVDDGVLVKARSGIYKGASLQGLSSEILEKYFTKLPMGYQVNKGVRDLCLFSKHDVTSDPPFAKVDLISCRNLLIYFSQALQKRVLPIFHYALNESGVLLLGSSESVAGMSDLFDCLDNKNKIYLRQQVLRSALFQMPLRPLNSRYKAQNIRRDSGSKLSAENIPILSSINMQKEVDRHILQMYGPCAVIVDDDLDILQFNGKTAPYFEQTTGRATHRLLRMAHPSFSFGLRKTINSAKALNTMVRSEPMYFISGKDSECIVLVALPLNPQAATKNRYYLILVEKQKNTPESSPIYPGIPTKSLHKKSNLLERTHQKIQFLEQQLTHLQEYQKTLSEDHKAAQEEISSTNEELQTSIEELQSTNEELETAKEEILSTNEELTTVNDELQNRNSQLGQLNDDLVNLFAMIEIPIVIIGADLKIRRLTDNFEKVFGIHPQNIEQSLIRIQSQLNMPHLDKILQEVMRTQTPREIEIQDIQNHWFKLQIRPYKTTKNKNDGVVLAFVDIETMKLAMGKLEVALDYATSIADALRIPSLILNRNLQIKSVNRLFCEIFDVEPKNLEGQHLSKVGIKNWLDSDRKKEFETFLEKNKYLQDFEIAGVFGGLGVRTFLLNVRQILWTDLPDPESLLMTLSDITGRKIIEEERSLLLSREREARLEAEKANRAKDLFMATLSHELRTPLASIVTWAQLIRSGKVDFEKAKAGAAVIERSAKTQSQLIDDLLDFSRIIAGKLSIEILPVDPALVIPQAVDSVLSLAEKKSILIKSNINVENCFILANPVRLQQIVWNLLTNSIKFSPKSSQIEVTLDTLEQDGRKFLRIQVIDQGKGIPVEFLPYIFNQFSQADSSSTRAYGGLGLGLSIVHNLVELQGGRIFAENAKQGQGALFTVLFPITNENMGILPSPQYTLDLANSDAGIPFADQPSLGGVKILIVDDDDSTREALTIYLRSYGAEVEAHAAAYTVIAGLKIFKPHVLISDIAMPGEDGYSLLRKIRQLPEISLRNIPAIALTAYASTTDIQRAVLAGFQAHFAKPVETADLVKAIVQLL